MDSGIIQQDSINRATYGFKSHIGTDPNKFIPKPFDINLKRMSNYLMNQLRLHDGGYYLKEMDLSIDFKSVVVLPYCSIMDVKKIQQWAGTVILHIIMMVHLRISLKYKTHLLLSSHTATT